MEKYIPQVGDMVRLLISHSNMNDVMESIVNNNPIVKITDIEAIKYGSEPKIKIRFNGDEGWDWTLHNKHFELYETIRKPNKSHNKALIKLIKYADK